MKGDPELRGTISDLPALGFYLSITRISRSLSLHIVTRTTKEHLFRSPCQQLLTFGGEAPNHRLTAHVILLQLLSRKALLRIASRL